MPRYDAPMRLQLPTQGSVIGASHHPGDKGAVFVRDRQRLCLLIVEILQAVFEVAQVNIGLAQLLDHRQRQDLSLPEQRQRFQGGPHAQRRFAPAADDLEYLHQEFYFANATRAELDVVCDFAPLYFLADLGMQAAQAGDDAVVQVAPVDERHDHRVQFRSGVARDRARLDPGVTLPFAPLRGEILLEHVEAHGERTAVAIRPQPRIHPEHETLRGYLGQRGYDLARESREEFMIGNGSRAVRGAVFRIGEYHVDVRRHVELAAAELAHRDDLQVLDRARDFGPGITEFAGKPRCVVHNGRVDRLFRQRRDGVEHFGQIGAPGEVARDQAQHHELAQPAQRFCQLPLIFETPIDK